MALVPLPIPFGNPIKVLARVQLFQDGGQGLRNGVMLLRDGKSYEAGSSPSG